jgi:hypothetical protein
MAMALGRTAYKRNTSAEEASHHRTNHQPAWTLFNFFGEKPSPGGSPDVYLPAEASAARN